MTEINFENYQTEISKSEKTVLLFFYDAADTAPEQLEELEDQAGSAVKFCIADVQGGGAVFASLYGILSLPTCLLLKNGKEIARCAGNIQNEKIADFLQQSL